MNVQEIPIGVTVAFVRHGVTREGRVFGIEQVTDDPRRQRGTFYTIACGDGDVVTVHHSAVAPRNELSGSTLGEWA